MSLYQLDSEYHLTFLSRAPVIQNRLGLLLEVADWASLFLRDGPLKDFFQSRENRPPSFFCGLGTMLSRGICWAQSAGRDVAAN